MAANRACTDCGTLYAEDYKGDTCCFCRATLTRIAADVAAQIGADVVVSGVHDNVISVEPPAELTDEEKLALELWRKHTEGESNKNTETTTIGFKPEGDMGKKDKKDKWVGQGTQTSGAHHYTQGDVKGYSARCEHVCSPVFAVDNVNYYGATGSERALCAPADPVYIALYTGLASKAVPSKLEVLDADFSSLKSMCGEAGPPAMVLDWPDYGNPPVVPAFWLSLHNILAARAAKSKKPLNVVLFCQGGHGRTGTALASIMVACGTEARTALKFIWDVYCREAVETQGQEDYVYKLDEILNGRKVPTKLILDSKTGTDKK